MLPIFADAATAPTSTCAGGDPAVTSVTSRMIKRRDGTDHYVITATVTNIGMQTQSTDITQRVELVRNRRVLAPQTLPALGAGVAYVLAFAIDRPASQRSQPLNVTVRYQLLYGDAQLNDCNRANNELSKTF